MAHSKKLVIGGVSLVKHNIDRVLFLKTCKLIMNDLGGLIEAQNLFKQKQFRWIGLILRVGNKFSDVDYAKIDKKDGELPVAIEVPAYELEKLDENDLRDVMFRIVISVLLDIAEKYNLPKDALLKKREEISENK